MIKPEEFATKHFGEYKLKGDEVIPLYCPYCEGGSKRDKETSAMNIETGAFNCKRGSCSQAVSFTQLCRDFGEAPAEHVKNFELGRRKQKVYVAPVTEVSPAQAKVEKYLKQRGISKETWEKFKVGESKGNIVFPYYENGQLVLVKFRKPEKYTGEGQKAWREKGGKAVFWGMDDCDTNLPLVITEGECFPESAQVLTPEGWIAFRDYAGQRVLQVHHDLTASFVKPMQIIRKHYSGMLFKVDRGGNYCSETTPGHNIVYQDKKGVLHKRCISEMPATIRGRIPTTVRLDGEGIPLSNDQLALCLVVSADASIDYRKGNGKVKPKERRYARIGLKKQRKIQRLCQLLNRLHIECSCNEIDRGYTSICFSIPDWCCERLLPQEWVVSATLKQRLFILQEARHWDGNLVPDRNQTEFSSKHFHNASIIQTIAHTSGFMSTIMKRSNRWGEWYKVSILYGKSGISWQNIIPEQVFYNGTVYCLAVESGMLLVRQENKITVTGNCDALALAEAGVKNVVSVPSGSEDLECVTNCWDWLQKFNKVIIWPDGDEPGQKMARELINKLSPWRCWIVKVEYKDANEMLFKTDKEAVTEAVENAHEVPIAGLVRLADVRAFDIESMVRVPSTVSMINEVVGGYALGFLSVWTGESGAGKSTFLGQEMLRAVQEGFSVCAYSGELPGALFRYWIDLQAIGPKDDYWESYYDPIKKTKIYKPKKEAVEGVHRWYYDKFFICDSFGSINDEDLLELFDYAYKRYDCRVFLADNLMTMNFTGDDRDYYRKQGRMVGKLKDFAYNKNVHVHLVAHPRKNDGRLTKNDVAGSKEITNRPDNVFGVYRCKEEDKTHYQGYLDIFKNRWSGLEQKDAGLQYDSKTKRIYQPSDGGDWEYGW